jgi:hypothetical protein
MFRLPLTAMILAFGLAQASFAQDDSGLDDATSTLPEMAGAMADGAAGTEGGLDDAMAQPFGDLSAPEGTAGPIAFATILSDGRKHSGTTNVSSSYNAALNRYEIEIQGERYFYTSYTTLVTPAGDARACRTSSVGGRLLVMCADSGGRLQPSRFAFVTFK